MVGQGETQVIQKLESNLRVLQISLSACSIVLSSALNSNSFAKFTLKNDYFGLLLAESFQEICNKEDNVSQRIHTNLLNVWLSGDIMSADILNELLVGDCLDLDVRPRVNGDQHLRREDSNVSI